MAGSVREGLDRSRIELTGPAKTAAGQCLQSPHPKVFHSGTPLLGMGIVHDVKLEQGNSEREMFKFCLVVSFALVPKCNGPGCIFHIKYSAASYQRFFFLIRSTMSQLCLPPQCCGCESLSVDYSMLDGRRIQSSCISCPGFSPDGSGS
jgi:hypothetical protein